MSVPDCEFISASSLFLINISTFFNHGKILVNKICFSFPTEWLSIGVSSKVVNTDIPRFLINVLLNLNLKSEEPEAVKSMDPHSGVFTTLKMMANFNLFSLDLFCSLNT